MDTTFVLESGERLPVPARLASLGRHGLVETLEAEHRQTVVEVHGIPTGRAPRRPAQPPRRAAARPRLDPQTAVAARVAELLAAQPQVMRRAIAESWPIEDVRAVAAGKERPSVTRRRERVAQRLAALDPTSPVRCYDPADPVRHDGSSPAAEAPGDDGGAVAQALRRRGVRPTSEE